MIPRPLLPEAKIESSLKHRDDIDNVPVVSHDEPCTDVFREAILFSKSIVFSADQNIAGNKESLVAKEAGRG